MESDRRSFWQHLVTLGRVHSEDLLFGDLVTMDYFAEADNMLLR